MHLFGGRVGPFAHVMAGEGCADGQAPGQRVLCAESGASNRCMYLIGMV